MAGARLGIDVVVSLDPPLAAAPHEHFHQLRLHDTSAGTTMPVGIDRTPCTSVVDVDDRHIRGHESDTANDVLLLVPSRPTGCFLLSYFSSRRRPVARGTASSAAAFGPRSRIPLTSEVTMVKEPERAPGTQLLRRFPCTSVAFGVAVIVMIAAVVWHIDVFELPGFDLIGFAHTEVGEMAIAWLLLIPAFFVDRAVDRARVGEANRVNFALSAARIGVWEWELASDRVTCSTTWAAAFGVRPNEVPTTSREFFELVHPDDRQSLGEATERAMRERTDLATEFRTTTSAGPVRWVAAHGRVAYDVNGKPVRVLGVNIDISHRKSLEEQLLEAHRQADRLRVLQATMRTVQDIVNNNLNQLQLLRVEAEGHVADDTLTLFDATIQDTAAQLTALANMETFAEKPMEIGLGVDRRSAS
jgi:PAS domain S-box-containing protein